MQVIFAGGASGVGASCVAINIAEQWIVVDAGVRVDRAADPLPDLALLEGKDVKAIFVTHAHADHIGALPLLHRAFPSAPIFTSRATNLLMEIMLADALKIMNKRAVEEMEIPLYPATLVSSMLSRVRPIPVGESCTLTQLPGITIHTSRAGHIAGAMSLGFASEHESIVVSGDISLTPQRTVLGAVPPDLKHPDLLILESTYGARLHPNRQAEEQRMAQAVAAGLANGGHVLLPCFGLGRGQEILLLLQAAQEQGIVPVFPIYVDGLIRRVCTAYQLMPEALTPRLERQIRKGFLPFQGDNVTFVRDAKERQSIIDGPPACIIASSGMLTGGPSAWYAARLAPEPKASILITGYQDEESPGKRLLDVADHKQDVLVLDGQQVPVQCAVAKYSLSAHADGGELASYSAQLKPRRVALVHGDEDARHALVQLLEESEVLLPTNGDTLDLSARKKSRAAYAYASQPVEKPAAITESLPYGIGEGVIFNASHLEQLWSALALKPSYQVVTVRDLVTIWYGDSAIPEHALWLQDVLDDEQPYDDPFFVPVSEISEAYYVRRTQEETREERLRNLVGRIILLRTNPGAAKPVLCRSIDARDTLRVLFPRGESNDRTRFPLRALLEVIGPLPYEEGLSERETLTTSVRTARRLRRRLSAHELACACEEDTSYTLSDLCELAGVSVHALEERLAVAKLIQQHPAIFTTYDDFIDGEGLIHYGLADTWQEALAEPEQRERPDQNWILATLENYIGNPPELIRRSLDTETGNVTLTFLYPEGAWRRYHEVLDLVAEETGVTVTISSQTPLGELSSFVQKQLPEGLSSQGNPSIFNERKVIRFTCRGSCSEEAVQAAQDIVLDQTGWSLEIVGMAEPSTVPAATAPALSSGAAVNLDATSTRQPVAEHEAIVRARELLNTLAGFRKVGLEKANYTLRVRFEFPDVALQRYSASFAQLEERTGWHVVLYPVTPTQDALVAMAHSLIPDGLTVVGRPSIYWDRQTVGLLCNGSAEIEAIHEAQRQFADETAWTLEIQGLELKITSSISVAEAAHRQDKQDTHAVAGASSAAPVLEGTDGVQMVSAALEVVDIAAEEAMPRVSQPLALAKAGELLSDAQDLYQLSADPKRGNLWLHFHFPDHAREQYAERFAAITAQTGWNVELHQRVHVNALTRIARQLIPIDAHIIGKPLIFHEQQRVTFTGTGIMSSEAQEEAKRIFNEETGWQLELRIPTVEL
ncbi:MBL fold metallo-hydrolase [Dictyobacter arantiisoli]|uniref:MBL fold hydrolase n=1 Tax=Dictyobacter arantiisoli TaxID=2014874 RepID=A0A5A5TC26_9CHLR|nr:MBL fold metallo-hydrolase [Dictyobacter arantiisoli]GCF08569.1 hypothetical protein KDI_21330 [Dictyobacter arantiisoli]